MNEIASVSPTPLFDAPRPPLRFVDVLRALRRRRIAMSVVFSIVMAVTLVTVLVWPPSFRAVGTILIEQQELPPDLVRSAITSYADQRIQVISQRVMTTQNLFKIIDRYGLYADMRQTAPREKIIRQMREDISFQMISADVIDPRAGRPTKATIAFSVGYANRSPDLAARVANELVSLYLQVNLDSRKQDAANAAEFMRAEAAALDRRIVELQSRIAEFKARHLNELPEQGLVNLQLASRTDDELRTTETQLQAAEQQISYYDAQLAQLNPSAQVFTSTGERVLSATDRLKYLRTESARVGSLYSPDHPDVLRMQREIAGLEADASQADTVNDLDRRIDSGRNQIALATQRYSPDHPDMHRLERELAALRAQRDMVTAQAPAVREPPREPDNPAYVALRVQRESAVNQRKALETRRDQLRQKLGGLELRMARAPAVERDYASLERELENAQVSYRLVQQKQLETEQSKNLEDEAKGERFTLIEPPVPPQQPSSPNRLALLLVGLLGAGALAGGVVVVRESFDSSIRDRQDLYGLLGIAPLAVLPYMANASEQGARERLRRRLMLAAVVVMSLSVPAVHFLYRPLDILLLVVLRRLGLGS